MPTIMESASIGGIGVGAFPSQERRSQPCMEESESNMHTSLSTSIDISPSTFVDILRMRALQQRDRLAYIFLSDDGGEVPITYGELDLQARRIASHLQTLGELGERVLLLFSPGLDYITGFLGVLYAGYIAVPAYLPRSFRQDKLLLQRLRKIAVDARPLIAMTTSHHFAMIETAFEQIPELRGIHLLDTEKIVARAECDWQMPALERDSLAFLQYTSGSTAAPKGVMVSHGNLLHNSRQISQCFEVNNETIGVSWLPPYHDMGLIGGILQCAYAGCLAVLFSPIAFLQRPFRWLQTVSRYKATITGAPNFAYELCIRKINVEQLATLDLSHWRVAYTGAESVRAETLARFYEKFAPCGFQPRTFLPCYGLAEATLLVSGKPASDLPVVYAFQTEALQRNHVVKIMETQQPVCTLVSCGHVYQEQKVVIVDPESLTRSEPDVIGEIWVMGSSVAQGYWNNEEATTGTFRAYLADTGEGPFLRTGDLGFIANGEIFVTGRLKDLIIIRGQNYYPQDIEQTVEQCHTCLRPYSGAAFAVEIDGEERLVVVEEIELQYRNSVDVETVVSAIRQAVADAYGLQVYDVVLLKTGHIAKTSSGKIQHYVCRAQYLDGTLEALSS